MRRIIDGDDTGADQQECNDKAQIDLRAFMQYQCRDQHAADRIQKAEHGDTRDRIVCQQDRPHRICSSGNKAEVQEQQKAGKRPWQQQFT